MACFLPWIILMSIFSFSYFWVTSSKIRGLHLFVCAFALNFHQAEVIVRPSSSLEFIAFSLSSLHCCDGWVRVFYKYFAGTSDNKFSLFVHPPFWHENFKQKKRIKPLLKHFKTAGTWKMNTFAGLWRSLNWRPTS